MADGEVTVPKVDKPLLEEANGGDNLTETEPFVSHPEPNALNQAGTGLPRTFDASSPETNMEMETGLREESIADTVYLRNEEGTGVEAVFSMVNSPMEVGVGEEGAAEMFGSRNEGGEEELSAKEESVLNTNETHSEAVVEVAPVVTSESKSYVETEVSDLEQLEPESGCETIVTTGQSLDETVPNPAPVLEPDIEHALDIEVGAATVFASSDNFQLGGDNSEAVDLMVADIPTGEANRDLKADGNTTTKTEDDVDASFPAVEATRESETDGESDRKVEVEGAASFQPVEAYKEMETSGDETTIAKEDELMSFPTVLANREMRTDLEDATEYKEDEVASTPNEDASREETDGEEATKAEEDEVATIPIVEASRQLETNGEEDMKDEEDEVASIPTVEASRQLETDGEDDMKAEDDEAASIPTVEAGRQLETDEKYTTKADDGEDDSVPTEEANREWKTDGDDVMEAEDRDIPSVQTWEDSQEDPQSGENEVNMAEETTIADTEVETETDVADSGKASAGKRKKGKNSKSPSTPKTTSRAPAKKVTEEDVCFICFDGGDLVLCDRRGCPKAYHPSCVNRDEAFFRAKGRWNCGWHLCSICEKNAQYMCYTCTYSLCKGCIKSAVILCIRGNKGFCENCMRTVRLIESKQPGDKEDTLVDFDDKSSWEYLFKDYYMDLKERLSLSLEEIDEAKSPWKGSDVSGNRKEQNEQQLDNNEDGDSGSESSGEKVDINRLKRRKINKKPKSLSKEDGMTSPPVNAGSVGTSTPSNSEWGSKELIDFVKHMRNGDTTAVSQFDVQRLLLMYIKRNKLRTPNKMSQIMCDSRLQRLFGKPRVMHFEMLKLLESHFLLKEDSHTDDAHGTVVDTEMEADEYQDTPVKEVKDRKHKRKKGHSRGPQSNLDDYAAIDMHNIGLIYVRRKLMEDLLEDGEKFQEKVVGTFVRIRISGNNQKQDLYRLVQVIGLSRTSDSYKVGKRTTDIMLEILNLNKTELISIDTISNQDFTEDECNRLRQSMKCGLVKRPTVGVILDKAMEVHEARVSDWLESEVLRITNLRDRASEKGRRKELRECVEKLALLKTPEERQRRLDDIPQIHDDPKMDPSYESEDDEITVTDDYRRDSYTRSRDSSFNWRGRDPISPRSNFSPKDPYISAGSKMQSKNWEPDRYSSSKNTLAKGADATHASEIINENSLGLGRGDRDLLDYRNMEKGNSTSTISRSEMTSGGLVPMTSSPVTPTAKATDNSGGAKINESEKIWHYQDPSGKNQGPFSIVQLRKWNNTGYFPADLRIWKSTEKQEESILLTDALAGRFQKVTENKILAGVVLQKHGERLNLVDQTLVSPNVLSGSIPTGVSGEMWGGNDSFNLPSPTPKQANNAVPSSTSFPGENHISEPSRLVLPAGVPSLLASSVSAGQPLMNSENALTHSSTGFSPMTNTSISEPPPTMMMVHNQHAAQDPNPHLVQNPNVDANVLGAVPTTPGQPQGGYSNWGGGIMPAVPNLAATFSNTGGVPALPQPEYWMGQTQGSQPNIQPQAMPNVQWMPQNGPATVWGTMPQGNPNMGWVGPAPAMNMNWGAPVQTMAAPNVNPGWVMPTGPFQVNMNPGWVPQPMAGNPGVPAMAPPNANPGWATPTALGPRDNCPQGGDNTNGFNDGRSWNNRQATVGGPPRGGFNKRQMLCPYNTDRRCRKGARCDYRHA
ncbi:unnamed protein product [Cuscuta europaea]|uniref:Zinc finger CCCH domain-containing protein 19 n=1 Tax=Cuscuta europaea TaxID=41803 RepID=A0A9P0YHU7_CUSEU|nr:unnamed protein product [Cuscuta europaea]